MRRFNSTRGSLGRGGGLDLGTSARGQRWEERDRKNIKPHTLGGDYNNTKREAKMGINNYRLKIPAFEIIIEEKFRHGNDRKGLGIPWQREESEPMHNGNRRLQ